MSAAARRLRSLLFAPASRPDVCAKLPRSGPDGVVIDLEDAVPADGKADARVHARAVGEQLANDNPGLAVYVRVNAVLSEWFERDVAEALSPGLAGVVVPKLESAEQVDTVAGALSAAGLSGLHVLAGIETAAGVARADAVMRPPVAVAYFGAEDFISDMGGVRTESNAEVLYARSRVALAARLAGVHALDQIVATLDDEARFRADALQALSIGYRGKLCIHPSQVPLANEVFSPSDAAIAHARALLAAYEDAQAAGQQVIVFDGQMIDEALARRARDLLAAADLEEG
jgi:citrate lyase subunit beta / citryl-CoA lyase